MGLKLRHFRYCYDDNYSDRTVPGLYRDSNTYQTQEAYLVSTKFLFAIFVTKKLLF